jgi:Histidine kinase
MPCVGKSARRRTGRARVALVAVGLAAITALAILLGIYWGLNQLIGLRSGPPIAAWKPFVGELSSVLVILALSPFIVRMEQHFRLDARLRHLTAQVDPHFLFNALNAIFNRMREDVDAAGDYELVLRDGQRLALRRRYKQLLPATLRERL